jgi:hypothetical protein
MFARSSRLTTTLGPGSNNGSATKNFPRRSSTATWVEPAVRVSPADDAPPGGAEALTSSLRRPFARP